MEIFDNALIKIYNFFENSIMFLKKNIGEQFISFVFDIFDRIYAASLITSSILLALASLVAYFESEESMLIWLTFLGPIMVLLLGYLSESFHEACKDSLISNPTSISNDAYLKLSGVVNFLLAVLTFLAGIYFFIKNPLFLPAYQNSLIILLSLYLLVSTAPYFNPSLINLAIAKNSSAGDDVIGITSFALKSLVFQERLLSRALVLIGAIYLILSVFNGVSYLAFGVGFLFSGIFLPVIVYLFFIFFFFINSMIQAVLAIPKINAK
mgnify:CR=1 FL=1|tara:strand:- start:63 stop:863 length:801 start_codon:yes stop_codon:yes gene_type:complete